MSKGTRKKRGRGVKREQERKEEEVSQGTRKERGRFVKRRTLNLRGRGNPSYRESSTVGWFEVHITASDNTGCWNSISAL